jgi:hypothetical protein
MCPSPPVTVVDLFVWPSLFFRVSGHVAVEPHPRRQRRYEVLRAFFVEQRPQAESAVQRRFPRSESPPDSPFGGCSLVKFKDQGPILEPGYWMVSASSCRFPQDGIV